MDEEPQNPLRITYLLIHCLISSIANTDVPEVSQEVSEPLTTQEETNNAEIIEENDIEEQIKKDLELLNTPIAFLTINELTREYETNTLKANQNYSGFVVEVTGGY